MANWLHGVLTHNFFDNPFNIGKICGSTFLQSIDIRSLEQCVKKITILC